MVEASEHDVDFCGWTEKQAALLRAKPRDLSLLDFDDLAEEIEDMGRSEIRAVSSLLHQTLAHLLKLAISPDGNVADHRFREVLAFQGSASIDCSPGLRQRLDLPQIWRVACNGATRELRRYGIAVPPLPSECPLTLDQLLDSDFDPDAAIEAIASQIAAAPAVACGRR